MTRISPLILLLAAAAAIFHAGPQEAYACTCAALTEGAAEHVLEYDAAIVIARANFVKNYGPEVVASLKTELVLSRRAPPNIVVLARNHPCERYTALTTDNLHLLVLSHSHPRDGVFLLSQCSGFPLTDEHTAVDQQHQGFLDELQRLRFEQAGASGASPLLIAAYAIGSVAALSALIGLGSRRGTS